MVKTALFSRAVLAIALLAAVLVIAWAVRASFLRREAEALIRADPEAILSDPVLARTALALGGGIFRQNCAACHGPDGKGGVHDGVPVLSHGDWLYGQGLVAEVEQVVLHGIRSGDTRGWDLASMPAYARAKPSAREPIPPLRPAEIQDVAVYLRSLHGRDGLDLKAIAQGRAIFIGKGGCWDCHGGDAGGDPAIGAPNLVDDIWLYGDGSQASVARSIAYGRMGHMPAFAHSLTPVEARAVSAYVVSLSRKDGREHGAN